MWQVIVKDANGAVHAQAPLDGGEVTLGRGRDCTIVLNSKLVSRLHGRFLSGGGRVLYKDEGSANGSTVNGQPIHGAIPVDENTPIEIAEFRVEIQRAPSASAAAVDASAPAPPVPVSVAPAPVTDSLLASMTQLLDRQISGIQSQRNQAEEDQRSARERFEGEWQEALTAASELRKRFADHPKVRYFVIARDGREVSVNVSDGSRRGHCNMILSRRHPDKDAEIDGRVWYGETGMEPESYTSPKDALTELVRRIAAKLA